MITFTIPGKPFAKQRPRVAGGHAYTPNETVSFERVVGTIAKPLFPEPLKGPILLRVFAVFEMPQSWSKKKREEMCAKPHTQRPDLDNILKAISDGLNRIAFEDDGQIAELFLQKWWDKTAYTKVFVEPWR